jgi:hypothetical protein
MDEGADILPIERGGQVRILGDGDHAVSGFRLESIVITSQ